MKYSKFPVPNKEILDYLIDEVRRTMLKIAEQQHETNDDTIVKISLTTKPLNYKQLGDLLDALIILPGLHSSNDEHVRNEIKREKEDRKLKRFAISKGSGSSKLRTKKILEKKGLTVRQIQSEQRKTGVRLYNILLAYIFECRKRVAAGEMPNIVRCPKEISGDKIFYSIWMKNRIRFLDCKQLSDEQVITALKKIVAKELQLSADAFRQRLSRVNQQSGQKMAQGLV